MQNPPLRTGRLPPSLWNATSDVPAPLFDPLDKAISVDVAVVGGGYTGLSAALHLAEAGRSVCVLEGTEIGYGASGRNGGQVLAGLKLGEAELTARFGESGRRLFEMAEGAPDFVAQLLARKSMTCRFERSGALRLPHNEAARKRVFAAALDMQRRGVDAHCLDAAETARVVGSSIYRGALLDKRAGSIHPLEYVRELARVAHEVGARIHARTPALKLEQTGSGWTVHTPAARIQAKTVLVATNGYSDGLIPGLARTLLPVNSFQVATAPLDAVHLERLMIGNPCAYETRRMAIYFRKSFDGRFVFGGRASFSSREAGAPVADYSVMIREMHARFPSLREVPVEHRWTGLVCITPDFIPHYHEPAPNLRVLLGFNGRGVALSTRAGAWIAHRIAGVHDDGDMPVTPIRPIPFHGLRAPALNLAMQYYRVLDAFGA
jgi:glycine/D-amino acid oxidase-like deaminating enzyme